MTDKKLTPEQDVALRRLLADARQDEPMPEDVALRLDDVLAGLVAERAEEADDAGGSERPTVVPLRRRRWPKVLVAAASVCAIGIGATQVIGGGAGDDAATDSGGQALVESDDQPQQGDGLLGGNDPEEAPEVPEPGPASAPAFEDGNEALDDSLSYYNLDRVSVSSLSAVARQLERSDRGPLQVLAPDHLPSKLRRLLGDLDKQWGKAGQGNRGTAEELSPDRAYDARIAPVACGPVYTVVGGRATYATYHGKLALVIFHPEVHGAQLVELYVCSGRTPRRSVERVTLWAGE